MIERGLRTRDLESLEIYTLISNSSRGDNDIILRRLILSIVLAIPYNLDLLITFRIA